MTYNLVTSHNPTKNAEFISELDGNAKKVQDALNQLDKNIKDHESSTSAHDSSSITFNCMTVKQKLIELTSTINNLVLAAGGNDITEVVQSRIGQDGTQYDVLKTRLDTEYCKLNTAINNAKAELQAEIDDVYGRLNDTTIRLYFKDFLAKYNDPTTALQNALSLALLYPIHLIVTSDGENKTFELTKTISIYGNTHLTVLPGIKFLKQHTGEMFMNGDKGASYTENNGPSNIIVDGGGNFDCNGMEQQKQSTCFSIGHSDKVVFRDIEIRNVCGGHGIDNCGNNRMIIDHVRFLGYVDYVGDRYFSEAIQVDLMRSSDTFSSFGAYDNTATANLIVSECYFGSSSDLGAWPRAIGSHTSSDGVVYSTIKFINNIVSGMKNWAISAHKWQSAIITGNSFFNCYGGIRTLLPKVTDKYTDNTGTINPVYSQIIANNTFHTITTKHAIQVFGRDEQTIRDVTISGNIGWNITAEHGIQVSNVDGFSIVGNVLDTVAHHGYLISKSKNGVVFGNIGKNIDGNGIRVEYDNCDNVKVAFNSLRNIGYSGISINGGGKRINAEFNTIINPGNLTNKSDGYDGISVYSNIKDSSVRFNDVFYDSGTRMRYGLYISNTCENIAHYGNRLKDTGNVANLVDNGINSITSIADVA